MPGYNDLADTSGMSLAEIVAKARARRQMERARNPGARPGDRMGAQQQVSIEGDAPIQAQPVRPQGQGRVGVEIGPVTVAPQQPMQLPGVRVPVDASRMRGGQAAAPDPRNAMLKQLMAENMARGMSQQQAFAEAFRKVQASG